MALSPPIHVLMKRFGGRCVYCGKKVRVIGSLSRGEVQPHDGATKDHFLPIIHGGSHEQVNLVLACVECNGLKGNFNPYDLPGFLARFGPENLQRVMEEIVKHYPEVINSTQKC